MKNLLFLILGLAMGGGGFWLVSRHAPHEAKEPEAHPVEKSAEAGEIKLSKEQQSAAGLKVSAPEALELFAQEKGYGRTLDATVLITLKLEVEAAQAALEVSTKDFERIKTLFSQNQNVSARAFEVAEATVNRDRNLLGLAETKLHAALGPALSRRADFARILETLSRLEWTLVRVDIPAGAPEVLSTTFQVAPMLNERRLFEAELLGPAPVADLSLPGQGFWGIIKSNQLAPNTAVVAWLNNETLPQKGFVVPSGCLLQEGSEMMVYIQTGGETFKRVVVGVGRQLDKGAFITNGLSAQDKVVVEGAHQILSMTKTEPAE